MFTLNKTAASSTGQTAANSSLLFEELEQPKTWQAKIAAIDPADEEAMAVEQYAPHSDTEGDAVTEHARREEQAATEHDLAQKDPGLLAAFLPNVFFVRFCPKATVRCIVLFFAFGIPLLTSILISHSGPLSRCEFCRSGKGRQDHHRRDPFSQKELTGMF